jgi:serine/threonine protein phosphatase PrpC
MKVIFRWRARPEDPKAMEEPPEAPLDTAEPMPPPLPAPLPAPPRTSPELASKPGGPGIIGEFMFEAFGASDPGLVRSNNEDYFLVAPALGLYVVADGMGGAQAGEHASKLAVETLWAAVQRAEGAVDEDMLVRSFHEANERVRAASEADPSMEGMGTTLVAAVEKDHGLLVASVGDSRLYVFDNGELTSVTEDQTWVNEVGRRLGIDEEQLKTHPMRHVLTMAIGVSENLRVLTYRLEPPPGSTVLLCSDGLHGVALREEIVQILQQEGTLEEKAGRLIAAARERGGPDNITLVLLQQK